ncbi:TOB3 (member of AAA-ATPase family) [Fusarium subglutinans]|uniref:TOB3 (Member of AAA-ATPase family) n=1 Tax=Gibberella subglutinans TaxID=42677 RepID=A0A8H5V398_GIBSU|nr:TOB3 (member of AAA-ATPase family) [Fusarium subglutinans]KAF5609332.1 TOB3 (member of AAA-ATPase family) [Fusarium subglutinans]
MIFLLTRFTAFLSQAYKVTPDTSIPIPIAQMASIFRFNTSATEESVSPSKVSSCPPAIGADIEDRRKSSYWSFENDSARRMLPQSEITRDLVIDLPKLRQYEDSDAEHPSAEPAIIWTARVYQILKEPRGEGIRLYRPDLTYVDDRPIEFSIGLSSMKPPPETDEGLGRLEVTPQRTTKTEHLSTAVEQVEFGMMWYLLKPRTNVYAQVDGSTHATVVVGVRRSDISVSKLCGADSDGAGLVDLWRLETNGSRLRRGFFSTLITPYFGLRDVASLQICPVSIWDLHNGGERRGRLLHRAAAFLKALQRGNLPRGVQWPNQKYRPILYGQGVHDYSDRFKEYDGILINNYRSFYTTQDTQNRLTNRKSRPPNSNDIVMNQEGLQVQLNDVEHSSPETIRTHAGGSVDKQLAEHQLFLLISIDHVQESAPSYESISNLIIARDELKTIQALSNRQTHEIRHWSADFIEGKGPGQLILLHVAHIGTVETLIEAELMKWFDLAEAWNTALLVDEADIFLERRPSTAFLRRMEYFKGLLFLTTNRVGQIDDAFISRVRNGFFRKPVRERAGKVQIASDAKKWVLDTAGETSLNGRDIRKALQTAITLAEFESEEDPDYDALLVTVVTKAHFQKVLEMCSRFRSYVTSIRREDEMKRAQGRGDRNDYGNGFDSRMC